MNTATIVPANQGIHINVMGTDTEVLLTGSDTRGAMAMFIITAQPGQGVPLHLHRREEETFHVLSGRLRVQYEGQTRVLEPGDTVCLQRERFHAWFTEGDQPVRMLLIASPSGMELFFPELAPRDGQPLSMVEVLATSLRYGIEFAGANQ